MKKIVLSLLLILSSVQGADLGMKVYGKTCVECHGDTGKESAVSGKVIAQSKDVLTKLTGYKNGTYGGEQKALMQASLAPLSDEDLKAVSSYVETLK
ncbi:MAG: c-type cytochrome [Sulfuricurvum sp.]|nr:c-type cytochrome [Sulfuricurvum sp.]